MENILFGLEIMIIGFIVVIMTLYFLYFVILGFSFVCNQTKLLPRRKQGKNMTAAIHRQTAANNSNSADPFVAAITAAVSAFLGKPAQDFSILSIRPQVQAERSEWLSAGRKNLLDKGHDLLMLRREKKI